jgi:hypothetical protein
MTDAEVADQGLEIFLAENLRNQTHAAMLLDLIAIAGDDASALLPSMLQGVQAKIGQLG